MQNYLNKNQNMKIFWPAGVILACLILLLSLANEVAAAEYQCKGHPATIVMDPNGGVLLGHEHVLYASGNLLEANDEPNVIVGTRGNDAIFGNGGNDIICGGPGNDLIVGGPGKDRLYGGNGNDHLRARTFTAFSDEDLPGEDILVGGNGNDLLVGSGDRDVFRAGKGDDTIEGYDGGDIFNGGSGYDQCRELNTFDITDVTQAIVDSYSGQDVARGCEEVGIGIEVVK
ncbi:MAG: calcium-binding protein [Chloroflexota bacterium]